MENLWCLNSFSIFEIICSGDRSTKMYNMMCDINDHQNCHLLPVSHPLPFVFVFPFASSIIFNIKKFWTTSDIIAFHGKKEN